MTFGLICVGVIVVVIIAGLYVSSRVRVCLNCGRGLDDGVKEILIVFGYRQSSDGSGDLVEDKSFSLCRGCFESQSLDYGYIIDEFEQDNPSCTGEEQVRLKSIIDEINLGEFEDVDF